MKLNEITPERAVELQAAANKQYAMLPTYLATAIAIFQHLAALSYADLNSGTKGGKVTFDPGFFAPFLAAHNLPTLSNENIYRLGAAIINSAGNGGVATCDVWDIAHGLQHMCENTPLH